MIIKINDKEPVELRFTFSAFTAYEDRWGEPVKIDGISLSRILSFYYYVVLCSKKGWQTSAWLKEDEFIEYLNENPETLVELSDFVGENFAYNELFASKEVKKK